MGYGMHWRKVDATEEADVAAARVVWDAAIAERNAIPREESGQFNHAKAEKLGDWDAHEAYDGRTERYRAAQDKVMAASDAMHDAERSYFRLNIRGMSIFADLMYRIGMIFIDEPHPSWPRAEDYGLTKEQMWAAMDPEGYPETALTPEQREAGQRVNAEHDRILRWHAKEVPGIPDHKFSTNDGWIVLPAEADAAARIWHQFVENEGEEKALALVAESVGDTGYWLKWIAYLQGAVTHDGFEVH